MHARGFGGGFEEENGVLVENGAARVKSIDYIRAIVIIRPLSQEESRIGLETYFSVGFGVRGVTCRVPRGFQYPSTYYGLAVGWLFYV